MTTLTKCADCGEDYFVVHHCATPAPLPAEQAAMMKKMAHEVMKLRQKVRELEKENAELQEALLNTMQELAEIRR